MDFKYKYLKYKAKYKALKPMIGGGIPIFECSQKQSNNKFIGCKYKVNNLSKWNCLGTCINRYTAVSNIDKAIRNKTDWFNNSTKKKKGHWIWWIFPSNKPGANDNLKTYVIFETAPILLQSKIWEAKLTTVVNYIIKYQTLVPINSDDDINKLGWFVLFWEDFFKAKPEYEVSWLRNNINKIRTYLNTIKRTYKSLFRSTPLKNI